MHDYHAVETLVDRLRAADHTDVTEVRLKAGPAYSPVALRQAYEMLTLGTSLHGSRLVVESVDAACTCPACGAAWDATCEDVVGHLAICRTCGTPTQVEGLGGIVVVGISH